MFLAGNLSLSKRKLRATRKTDTEQKLKKEARARVEGAFRYYIRLVKFGKANSNNACILGNGKGSEASLGLLVNRLSQYPTCYRHAIINYEFVIVFFVLELFLKKKNITRFS